MSMNVRFSIFTVLPVALASFVMNPQTSAQPHPFERGKPFPSQILPNIQTGDPISLNEFRGEKVLLFLFASW